jgi:hypothetical protein
MAKFSPQDQGQDATQASSKEIEQLINEYQEKDKISNEDLTVVHGKATHAEATAAFLSQQNWIDAPQVSKEETEQATTEPQEQQYTAATEDLPSFTGATPKAEALANFLPQDKGKNVDSLNSEELLSRSSADTHKDVLANFAQMAHYDDNDSDIQEMQAWGDRFSDESPTHPEDRQLESIWKSKGDSVDRSNRTGTDKGETEGAATIADITERSEMTGRDKRQRPHANSMWREAIKRGAKGNSAAIVQQVTEPRQTIESPDRKKRAAPSPKRGEPKEDDESSMSSAVAEELANAVLNQIQEAPAEAIAPTGPRKDA